MKELQFTELLNSAIYQPGVISSAYSAFHNYSMGNMMAAAFQCAARGLSISPIASYKAWQQKGRQVKKGEKAISLCMPITVKCKKENEAGDVEEFAFARFVWRNNWFSLEQTEGEDYVNEIIIPEWSKESVLKELGITEGRFEHYSGNTQGYASGTSIAINPLAQYPHKTRFHELAHVVLGHTKEDTMTDSGVLSTDVKEVEAEAVAYLLCSVLDLPGLEESRGYVQHWLNGANISEKSAQKIFNAADKILKAGKVQ